MRLAFLAFGFFWSFSLLSNDDHLERASLADYFPSLSISYALSESSTHSLMFFAKWDVDEWNFFERSQAAIEILRLRREENRLTHNNADLDNFSFPSDD